jgi:hypothetical protein
LPVFWAGFSLALPESLAVRRFGALRLMAGGVLIVAACSAGVWTDASMEVLLPLSQCRARAGGGCAMGLAPRPCSLS